jgi:hypothetical protein
MRDNFAGSEARVFHCESGSTNYPKIPKFVLNVS